MIELKSGVYGKKAKRGTRTTTAFADDAVYKHITLLAPFGGSKKQQGEGCVHHMVKRPL